MNHNEDWRAGGFGLYVHWPFCAAKCPYCDFNSYVASDVDQHRWLRAFQSEIARLGRVVPGRILGSIFFGGGTPSLMDPATVDGVISAVRSAWSFANNIEITLEANPTSVEAGRFAAYRQTGINRLSMGIQALDNHDLHALGRQHSVTDSRKAFDIAKKYFDRVSFDLIYARQGQSREKWRAELAEALNMAADHLSIYQLTIEPETAFGRRYAAGRLRDLPSDDLAADMYFDTQEICEAAGMPAYEVSNHAAKSAESRHNLTYWRQGDWAAVGPGAHGRLTIDGQRFATEAMASPAGWLGRVEKRASGETVQAIIPHDEQATELLMMGLRLREGINLRRFNAMNRSPVPDQNLQNLMDMNLITMQGGRLTITDQGRPILNAILRELFA